MVYLELLVFDDSTPKRTHQKKDHKGKANDEKWIVAEGLVDLSGYQCITRPGRTAPGTIQIGYFVKDAGRKETSRRGIKFPQQK